MHSAEHLIHLCCTSYNHFYSHKSCRYVVAVCLILLLYFSPSNEIQSFHSNSTDEPQSMNQFNGRYNGDSMFVQAPESTYPQQNCTVNRRIYPPTSTGLVPNPILPLLFGFNPHLQHVTRQLRTENLKCASSASDSSGQGENLEEGFYIAHVCPQSQSTSKPEDESPDCETNSFTSSSIATSEDCKSSDLPAPLEPNSSCVAEPLCYLEPRPIPEGFYIPENSTITTSQTNHSFPLLEPTKCVNVPVPNMPHDQCAPFMNANDVNVQTCPPRVSFNEDCISYCNCSCNPIFSDDIESKDCCGSEEPEMLNSKLNWSQLKGNLLHCSTKRAASQKQTMPMRFSVKAKDGQRRRLYQSPSTMKPKCFHKPSLICNCGCPNPTVSTLDRCLALQMDLQEKQMMMQHELQNQKCTMMLQQELQNQRYALLLQKELQNQRKTLLLQQELQNKEQSRMLQNELGWAWKKSSSCDNNHINRPKVRRPKKNCCPTKIRMTPECSNYDQPLSSILLTGGNCHEQNLNIFSSFSKPGECSLLHPAGMQLCNQEIDSSECPCSDQPNLTQPYRGCTVTTPAITIARLKEHKRLPMLRAIPTTDRNNNYCWTRSKKRQVAIRQSLMSRVCRDDNLPDVTNETSNELTPPTSAEMAMRQS